MTRNRVRAARLLAPAALLVSLTACGGDPAPQANPTPTDPAQTNPTQTDPAQTDPAASSTVSAAPTFPSGAPLADGPWIPSPSLRIKVPRGFKGEAEFGVTTLRKGGLAITLYDPGSAGDSELDAAIKTEQELNFTGRTTVESGSATVDGEDVQTFVMSGKYEFFQRVAYGFGVTDTEGDTRFVVLGFEGEQDPTAQQDTIDSVLASIQWSKAVVG